MSKLSKNKNIFIVTMIAIIVSLMFLSYNLFVSNDDYVNVVIIFKNSELTEYWREVKHGISKAAQSNDVKVTFFYADSESDIEGQISLVDDAIRLKPDAIILASNDYSSLNDIARKVKENEIKLVMLDSGISYEGYDSFVATNNYEAGFKAGIAMKETVSENNKICIVNYVKGSQTAIDREKGVIDGLNSGGSVYDITTYYSYDSKDEAYRITKQILENKDVSGIVGLNETSSSGVALAVDELNLGDDITVIGYDSSTEEIKFLEKGIIDALVVQKPFNMGYISVETAFKLVNRKAVEKVIDTGSKLIYKDNMYDKENVDLLFPFVD